MADDEGNKKTRRKNRRSLGKIILLSLAFAVWAIVSEVSPSYISGIPLTSSNISFIANGIASLLSFILTPLALGINAMILKIQAGPENLVYLASPIAILGTIPLYMVVRKSTGERGLSMFTSLLYIIYALLVGNQWISLLYLSLFPVVFLTGLAAYMHNRRILSFLIMFAAIFIVPLSALAVLVFSLAVFYKDWSHGKETFAGNPYSIFLEGVSAFVFISLFMRYGYNVFTSPSMLYSSDMANVAILHAGAMMHTSIYSLSNVPAIAPEFTTLPTILLSLVVMVIVAAAAFLARFAMKRIRPESVDNH